MVDAAAMTIAAVSPEIDLVGITTVTGDATFRASVTRKFLDLLEKMFQFLLDLELDLSLPKKVNGLYLMGGMINPPIVEGKQIPRGFEYNFCQDPLSLEKIIKPKLFEITDFAFNLEIPDKYPRFIPTERGHKMKLIEATNFTKVREFIIEKLKSI